MKYVFKLPYGKLRIVYNKNTKTYFLRVETEAKSYVHASTNSLKSAYDEVIKFMKRHTEVYSERMQEFHNWFSMCAENIVLANDSKQEGNTTINIRIASPEGAYTKTITTRKQWKNITTDYILKYLTEGERLIGYCKAEKGNKNDSKDN